MFEGPWLRRLHLKRPAVPVEGAPGDLLSPGVGPAGNLFLKAFCASKRLNLAHSIDWAPAALHACSCSCWRLPSKFALLNRGAVGQQIEEERKLDCSRRYCRPPSSLPWPQPQVHVMRASSPDLLGGELEQVRWSLAALR